MYNEFLSVPRMMNMGFHYTEQYSRRTRVKVIGLVDQSSPEWAEWYRLTHSLDSVRKMADAGYDLIEIHFLYGFGLKGEAKEVELTRLMTENAHRAGLKVLGYFQFFSVQEELFFIENPWAKNCLQLNADGTRHEYSYARPALCFSHQEVKQYYLDGVELGLKYCDLDGIRLDNDYYNGCYCHKCKKLFREHLTNSFSPEEAEHIFGIPDLRNITLPNNTDMRDPAWFELVKFRQKQRQNIIKLIRDKVKSIKPEAILGGNPAVTRKFNGDADNNFYPADLGETHDLVCAENSLFPQYLNPALRSQAVIYKFGEAAGFKVYPSHHKYNRENSFIWPGSSEECALTLCEALCMGAHIPCTTWGIRMDGNKSRTLYERAHFIKATRAVSDFIRTNADIYKDVRCDGKIGIYINRESRICDFYNSLSSLWGTVQILLKNGIAFRFIPFDGTEHLKNLKLLIIPNVALIKNQQLENIIDFAKNNKVLVTGNSGRYDEYYLERSENIKEKLSQYKNIHWLDGVPEAVEYTQTEYYGNSVKNLNYPGNANLFLENLYALYEPEIKISEGEAVAINPMVNNRNEHFIHILNYNNTTPVDIKLKLPKTVKNVKVFSPEHFGVSGYNYSGQVLKLTELHTYAVVKVK
ncbi:MAG: beta-galactosidase [Victivallaceae bacterium]|nr:beta-galactosidase [Victivallaceae bacterium]